jgi:cytoskeleton-associated protein 5
MFVEVCNNGDAVSEALLKGFEHKQPKVVAASARVLSLAVNAFGPKVVNIKPVVKVRCPK